MSVSPRFGSDRASPLSGNVAGIIRSSETTTDLLENREPVVKLYFRSTSQNGYSTSPPPVQMESVPPFLPATACSTYLKSS